MYVRNLELGQVGTPENKTLNITFWSDLRWSICKKPYLLEHEDPLVSTILHRRPRLCQIAKSREGLLHTEIMID